MMKIREENVIGTGETAIRRGLTAAAALMAGFLMMAADQPPQAEDRSAAPADKASVKHAPMKEAPADAAAGDSAAPAKESSEEADWPCQQKFVAELSPGTIWSGPPLNDAMKAWHDNDKIRDLAGVLAQDTTEETDGIKQINDLAAGLKDDKNKQLTLLFAALFENFNNERKFMQGGIKKFFHRQEDVAAKVNKISQEIRQAQKKGMKENSPEDKTLKTKLDWANRVYDDRQRLLPYVCEVPALLEQKLGSYGRAIQAQMNGQPTPAAAQPAAPQDGALVAPKAAAPANAEAPGKAEAPEAPPAKTP
ncbi:MAG: hypothetical protein WAN51_08255 [Alphaproteobacteria bacterium]